MKTETTVPARRGGPRPARAKTPPARGVRTQEATQSSVRDTRTRGAPAGREVFPLAGLTWEQAFDAMPHGMLLQDVDFTILSANRAAAEMLGVNAGQLLGRKCHEILHPGFDPPPNCPFLQALGAKKRVLAEMTVPPTNRILEEILEPLLSNGGQMVGMMHTVRDLTEKKRAEEEFRNMHQGIVEAHLNLQAAMQQLKNTQMQLIHSEKMAAIGQLISGVAHELNNPLTGVLGYSQLLLAQELKEDTRNGLEKVYKEAQRATKIVQNLLSFARKDKPEKTAVQINALLTNVLQLRAYELKVNNIRLETDLDPRLPLAIADGSQLQQVFLNIVTNAEQALEAQGGGGTLTVSTRALAVARVGASLPRVPNIIRIEIADDGPGIPQERLGRIFDPFFTTKPVGKGTGLGLSICYGIVEEHGGTISAFSPPEVSQRGTCFRMELPIISGCEESEGSSSIVGKTEQNPP